jgi:hypothetical protein
VFVDVFWVSAVLYIINFANCDQNGPPKARKESKKGREDKESNHNRKKKEIVQKYVFVVNYAHYTILFYYEKFS